MMAVTMGLKSRPIIFGAESIRAILAGRKTQTRRVVKLGDPTQTYACHDDDGWPMSADQAGRWERDPAPYKLGQRLWVKETWAPSIKSPRIQIAYKSDLQCVGCGHDGNGGYLQVHHGWINSPETLSCTGEFVGRQIYQGWKSPLFMPRWASRLTLEVTAVRVERLQEISEEDAKAEGCVARTYRDGRGDESARLDYRRAWNKINGKKHSWDSNPWVWAITFKRVEA